MVSLFIAIAACIYFFAEAKKRSVSPGKWAFIAFIAFLGPQILLVWLLLPVILVFRHLTFGIPVDDSFGIQAIFGLGGFVIGFWLLIVSRKKLYRYSRSEPPEDAIIIGSLEIVEQPDGMFAVGERTFKSRKDAEEFVDFTRSIKQ